MGQSNWFALVFAEPRSFYRRLQINFNQWNNWTTDGTSTGHGGNINANSTLANMWFVHAGLGAEAIDQRKAQVALGDHQRIALVARTGPARAEIVGIEHQASVEVEIGIGAVEGRLRRSRKGGYCQQSGQDRFHRIPSLKSRTSRVAPNWLAFAASVGHNAATLSPSPMNET